MSDVLFNRCLDRFCNKAQYNNVHLYHGDSGVLLPVILSVLDEPCIYFLDAHYSAGLTAKGNKSSALEDEMKTIISRLPKYNDVVLVDDTYDLADTNGYLSTATIRKMVLEAKPDYVVEEQDFIHRQIGGTQAERPCHSGVQRGERRTGSRRRAGVVEGELPRDR